MQIVSVHTADGESNFEEILKRCFCANFAHQRGRTTEELDSEAGELARSLLEDENNSTIKQLEGYLLNQQPCVKCAVIEEDYIDRDFLNDYVSYHYRCFGCQSQKCCRVHFFSEGFDVKGLEQLLLNPDGKDVCLQDVYQGFSSFDLYGKRS